MRTPFPPRGRCPEEAPRAPRRRSCGIEWGSFGSPAWAPAWHPYLLHASGRCRSTGQLFVVFGLFWRQDLIVGWPESASVCLRSGGTKRPESPGPDFFLETFSLGFCLRTGLEFLNLPPYLNLPSVVGQSAGLVSSFSFFFLKTQF